MGDWWDRIGNVEFQRELAAEDARERVYVAEEHLLQWLWLCQCGATYCRACYARGGFHIPATWWEPEDYEPCGCCVGRDNGGDEQHCTCPRCGKPALDATTNESACTACGWAWGRGADDCLPQFF